MFKKLLRAATVALVSLGLAGSPALAFSYSTTLKNARLDAITTAIGTSGKMKIYTAGTTTCSGTLIVTLPLSSTAAASASSGVLTFNSITTTAASNSGTAACGTITKSDDTVVVDGLSVSTSGANINLNNTSINSGQNVAISSFTITHP